MKTVTKTSRIIYLLIACMVLCFATGCMPSKTVTTTEDLVIMIQQGRFSRTDMDDIAYDVREYIEQKARGSFAVDMWSYTDTLGYWVNAEMIDMCGTATIEYKVETATVDPTANLEYEVKKINVLIIFESYVESLDAMQSQNVYAELENKNGEWILKRVAQDEDFKSVAQIAPEGVTLRWLNH